MRPPRVVVSPRTEPPFPVDAIVEEEDTFITLSAGPALTVPDEHPIRILTRARGAREVELGTVVVRPGSPLTFLAIVHRLSEERTWREDWIAEAVENLRLCVARYRVGALGMPLLGTVHGKLDPKRAFALLAPVLTTSGRLERVWIMRFHD